MRSCSIIIRYKETSIIVPNEGVPSEVLKITQINYRSLTVTFFQYNVKSKNFFFSEPEPLAAMADKKEMIGQRKRTNYDTLISEFQLDG